MASLVAATVPACPGAAEYPPAYRLLAEWCGQHEALAHGRLTRELLACCLGVPLLTNGQLAALRKLVLDRTPPAVTHRAMLLIAQQWPTLKRFISHAAQLEPDVVQVLYSLAWHDNTIAGCRWLTYRLVAEWFANPASAPQGAGEARQLVCLFLVQWYVVRREGIEPQQLASYRQMVQACEQALRQRFGNGRLSFSQRNAYCYQVFARIDPGLHELAGQLFGELLGDALYNDSNSEEVTDSAPFPAVQGQAHSGFSPLRTAGDLRAMASALQNCASLRVYEGTSGRCEFWRYFDPVTGELALLQLQADLFPASSCVVEFNGLQNAGVSSKASSALAHWLASFL